MTTKLTLEGVVQINSGKMLIIDPCYLTDFDYDIEKYGEQGFAEVLAINELRHKSRKKASEIQNGLTKILTQKPPLPTEQLTKQLRTFRRQNPVEDNTQEIAEREKALR